MNLSAHPVAHTLDKLSFSVGMPRSVVERFTAAKVQIAGWSNPAHLAFFDAVLSNPAIKDVLVCGVYHGLDLVLMRDAAKNAGRESEVKFTGVDLFSGKPCADWPMEKCGMSWQLAGFGEPPTLAEAWKNAPFAHIVQQDASRIMLDSPGGFDFIYLDTSHDERTVRREIVAAKTALRPNGLIAGDDYTSPEGIEWGVEKVVQEMLPGHGVLFSRIWFSNHPARK